MIEKIEFLFYVISIINMSRHFETKTISCGQNDSTFDRRDPHTIFNDVLLKIIECLENDHSTEFNAIVNFDAPIDNYTIFCMRTVLQDLPDAIYEKYPILRDFTFNYPSMTSNDMCLPVKRKFSYPIPEQKGSTKQTIIVIGKDSSDIFDSLIDKINEIFLINNNKSEFTAKIRFIGKISSTIAKSIQSTLNNPRDKTTIPSLDIWKTKFIVTAQYVKMNSIRN